jgi:lysyl endopeptidase
MQLLTQKGKIEKIAVLFFLSFFLSVNSYAQINVGGAPISSLMEMNDSYNTVTMPSFDVQRFLNEDAALASYNDMPYRYGKIFETDYNLNNSGTWETLSDGSRIWRLMIRSENAMSINLAFKNFQMPKGATFFVYNPNKNFVYGAFTSLNNADDKQFATTPVPGNEIVLEYYEPEYSAGQGSLTVSQVVHAYKDILGFNSVLEVPCNVNIICPVGQPWVEQKRSVTRITFNQGGSGYLCTGSLVNNTDTNRLPYYLTAQHCETDNHSTMMFYFNYESPTCVGTTGALNQTMTGASLKAQNFATDFKLLLLNNTVPAAYNAYFNGWDRSGANPQNETAIHHPGGANKKISVDLNPASNDNGFGGRLASGFWAVFWDIGMTEGGSSGCPLYDQNKRVIGQNLGGTPANCDNPQSVYKTFGKFSESWAYGGNSTNQLKNWLDASNTNVMTLDGMNDLVGVAPAANFSSNVQTLPIGGGIVDFYDFSTNDPQTYSWSFPGGTPSTSTARNPTGISYTATGFYTVSLTATNSFGSNMKTVTNFIKVEGVPMNSVTLLSPPNNTTVIVSPNDPSLYNFVWSSASPSATVSYKFKIKKAGPAAETIFPSNNNGLDSVSSFRLSFLDSLAGTLGISSGDSATCIWRVTAFNGVDSISTAQIIVKLRRTTVGINQLSSEVPTGYTLYQNYPNPFNPSTSIKFDLVKNGIVKLVIYDAVGKAVKTLIDNALPTGSYEYTFNAAGLASGIYYYRISANDFSSVKKMLLIK